MLNNEPLINVIYLFILPCIVLFMAFVDEDMTSDFVIYLLAAFFKWQINLIQNTVDFEWMHRLWGQPKKLWEAFSTL